MASLGAKSTRLERPAFLLHRELLALLCTRSKLLILLEAAIGIEPMNKGFAVIRIDFAQVPACSL